jgi:hypothetical protein
VKGAKISGWFFHRMNLFTTSSSKEESQVFSFYTLLKLVNGCGGTSTFFPFHLTSFILRTLCPTYLMQDEKGGGS